MQINDTVNNSKRKDILPYNTNLAEFVCGGAASLTSVLVVYPMSKVVFRQMLHGISISPALSQLRYEGLASLYRGMLPPLIQKTASISFMFGVYDALLHSISSVDSLTHPSAHSFKSRYLITKQNANSSNSTIILASFLCGTLEALAFTPLERVQTLLQHDTMQHVYRNTFSSFVHLVKNYGVHELYRGFTPILWRNGPSTALFFEVRHPLRNKFNDLFQYFVPSHHYANSKVQIQEMKPLPTFQSTKLDPNNTLPSLSFIKQYLPDFVSGAVLGGCISTLFYPLNVARARMQSTIHKPLGLFQVLRIIYKERNRTFWGFFYGARINFSRSLVSWGIINASYEYYKRMWYKHYDVDTETVT